MVPGLRWALGGAAHPLLGAADAVEGVFPEWVSEAPDGMKMVTPVGYQALVVEALRELRQERDAAVAELEKENAELRRRLEELEKGLETLLQNQRHRRDENP